MSSPIGYVETVREDLLEAAWRSTMSSPRRAGRRRPSMRWVLATATAATLFVSGVIGWQILSPGVSELRMAAVPSPAPTQSEKTVGGNESSHRATLTEQPQKPFDGLAGAAPETANGASGSTSAPAPAGTHYAVDAPVRPVGDFSKVVKTGRMSIVVPHGSFGGKYTAIGDIADGLGGYVSESSTSGGKSGFVTLRIPANRFQQALRSLRSLGRVESESIQGNDVTAEYVDLRSRIDIAKARRTVLLRLMDRATSIDQTIRVQNALDDVQLRIEELQGQLNVLDDRVDQATIRVSMREAGVKVHHAEVVQNPSIGDALDHAVAGFISVVAGVIVGLGWVIPTLLVLAAVWFAATRVRRRLA